MFPVDKDDLKRIVDERKMVYEGVSAIKATMLEEKKKYEDVIGKLQANIDAIWDSFAKYLDTIPSFQALSKFSSEIRTRHTKALHELKESTRVREALNNVDNIPANIQKLFEREDMRMGAELESIREQLNMAVMSLHDVEKEGCQDTQDPLAKLMKRIEGMLTDYNGLIIPCTISAFDPNDDIPKTCPASVFGSQDVDVVKDIASMESIKARLRGETYLNSSSLRIES